MPRHTVTIMPHVERASAAYDESEQTRTTLATLLVRPAIEIGPRFQDAVLGVTKHGVAVEHVETAGNVTALIAESSARLREDRLCSIATISERVRRLSDELGRAALMMTEDPFPGLSEDAYSYSPLTVGATEPGER